MNNINNRIAKTVLAGSVVSVGAPLIFVGAAKSCLVFLLERFALHQQEYKV